MAEVRTTSATGGQKGVKPERHGLIPRKATAWISRVFGFGANKYEDHNWRRGYEWDKSIDALQRHIDAFVDGDTYDEESGLPHLAHAGFHIMVLLTWLEEQGEGVDNVFDTRWPHAMERARRAKEAAEAEGMRGPDKMWVIPNAHLEFRTEDVSPGVLEILTGQQVERDDQGDYAWPLRFIAGSGRMDCQVQPVLEGPATNAHDEHVDPKLRELLDEEATWAADIVTGQGINGVQRSFDLKD